jgi:hypothetical protein
MHVYEIYAAVGAYLGRYLSGKYTSAKSNLLVSTNA